MSNKPARFRRTNAPSRHIIPIPLIQPQPDGPPCDGCTECCRVMQVDEINKPRDVQCVNCNTAGCAIYATRPRSCRDFACLYRQGHLRSGKHITWMRPDNLGLMLTTTGTLDWLADEKIVQIFVCRPGVLDEPDAQSVIDQVSEKAVCVIIDGDNRKLTGPPEMVVQCLERLKAKGWTP